MQENGDKNSFVSLVRSKFAHDTKPAMCMLLRVHTLLKGFIPYILDHLQHLTGIICVTIKLISNSNAPSDR